MSGRYHVDPEVIERTWSWRKLLMRNRLLDAIEDAETEARERNK